jgi:hypothetical protein
MNEPRSSNDTIDPNEGYGGKATMSGLLDGIVSRIAAKIDGNPARVPGGLMLAHLQGEDADRAVAIRSTQAAYSARHHGRGFDLDPCGLFN